MVVAGVRVSVVSLPGPPPGPRALGCLSGGCGSGCGGLRRSRGLHLCGGGGGSGGWWPPLGVRLLLHLHGVQPVCVPDPCSSGRGCGDGRGRGHCGCGVRCAGNRRRCRGQGPRGLCCRHGGRLDGRRGRSADEGGCGGECHGGCYGRHGGRADEGGRGGEGNGGRRARQGRGGVRPMWGRLTHLDDRVERVVIAASALQSLCAHHLQAINIAEDVVDSREELAGVDVQQVLPQELHLLGGGVGVEVA
mmetsp:Transcript_62090/g.184951  ORF Transcript_62090/g.184951 Transcript_62090/m.184951 type:complete len:248 (-) Transcript_62090:652-1395(-)